jgi:transcription initiation factor TFIIE subunit alpha
MTIKKLKKEIFEDKKIVSFLEIVAGPYAPKILSIFNEDSEYTPLELSDKLKIKITNIRCVLNSLHYRGIACYKKNKKKGNFCEYKWSIKYRKIIEYIIEQEIEKLTNLENTLIEKKDRDFFVCPDKCVEIPFEIAAAYNFKCPNCDKVLELVDIKKKVANIKRKKTKLKNDINKLNEILQNIDDKTRGYICE